MHDDTDPGEGPGEHRTPRWVKISAIIALVLVVLLIAVLVFGGGPGGHGPGRHAGPQGTGHGERHTVQEGDSEHGGHASRESTEGPRGSVTWTVGPDYSTVVDGAPGNCMSVGDTYNRTFQDAGDVAYHCKLHGDDGMVAGIQVRQTHETPDGRHH